MQQRFLVGRTEQLQRAAVDVDDVDFAHATRDELFVDIGEDAKVVDAAGAHVIDQPFHGVEILHPQRYRRVGEQAKGVILAIEQVAPGALPLGYVLDRHHDTVPALFMAGKHPARELNIETLAGQGVIDRMAGEAGLPVPELGEFLDMALERIVAQHLAEICHQMIEVAGAVQRQGLGIDLQDADALGAAPDPIRICRQVRLDVGDVFSAPFLKQRPNPAIVLDPERNRRQIEHFGVAIPINGRNGHEEP